MARDLQIIFSEHQNNDYYQDFINNVVESNKEKMVKNKNYQIILFCFVILTVWMYHPEILDKKDSLQQKSDVEEKHFFMELTSDGVFIDDKRKIIVWNLSTQDHRLFLCLCFLDLSISYYSFKFLAYLNVLSRSPTLSVL